MNPTARRYRQADRWGMALSALCALHCLLVPLLFALLPPLLLALHSFQSPWRPLAMALWRLQAYDRALVAAALFVAVLSLLAGWRRHRCPAPWRWLLASLPLFAYGLSPLAGSLFGHGLALAGGGACLFRAHQLNLRLGLLRPQPD